MCDKITRSIDNNVYAIGVFFDLSKAFDTINHDILIQKLYHYGVRGVTLDWFKSYLANRFQFVNISGVSSQTELITCGVPQGSIIGPLLFLIYINDIVSSSDLLSFILFADDTNLFYSSNSKLELMNTVNTELEKLSQWFVLTNYL